MPDACTFLYLTLRPGDRQWRIDVTFNRRGCTIAEMGKDRKRHGWAFWTIVAGASLIVVYPMSIGPAAWLNGLFGGPTWFSNIYMFVYRPIVYLDDHEPRWLGRMFARYVEWCCGTNIGDQTSRLIASAIVGAAMIALVIWSVNKWSTRLRRN